MPRSAAEDPVDRPAAPLGPLVLVAALLVGWGWLWLHGPLLDLHIYRLGARSLLSGADALYDVTDPASGLQFTYSPFAALVFTPFALLPETAAAVLLTGGSVLALARCAQLLGRLSATRWATPTLLLFGACVLEPVISTVSYGQINLILMWLVLEDLSRPGRRSSGIAIGLAAGVKLVPGIWILLLLLQRRYRAAGTATVTAAATALVGWLLLPSSTIAYFFGGALDPERTGGIAYLANQSVTGLIARLVDPSLANAHWKVVTVVVVLIGGLITFRCLRGGRSTEAVVAMALTGLLASPISWSHHWVWVLPIVAVLLASGRSALATSWIVVAGSWTIWWAPGGGDREQDWTWWQHLFGNAYVLLGVATLIALGFAGPTRRLRPRRELPSDRRPDRLHPRSRPTTG